MDSSDSSSEEELVVVTLALSAEEEERTPTFHKRLWVHEMNKKRATEGEFHTLFAHLKNDNSKFFQYFRMSYEKFCELLELIKPDIQKKDTRFRNCIPPKERLAVTLRYLGHGGSYRTISFSYRMGETTIGKIVVSTCKAIWQRLSPIVMPPPDDSRWKAIEDGFYKKWQYPNCIGALDGKHIVTEKPKNSGSLYFNYKKDFSIVLMALVDSDYKFITVDVGAFGKNSDGAVFRDSQLGKSLLTNQMDIPSSKALPASNIILPHVIVADEAFPLHKHIMRPYPGSQLNQNQANKIYNYRHSRARRVSENAFGILSKKFRIFSQKLQVDPENLDIIVLATTCLHNFLRGDDENLWQPGELERQETLAGMHGLPRVGGNATAEAFHIRESFKNYFISPEGKVVWQDEMVNRGRRNNLTQENNVN